MLKDSVEDKHLHGAVGRRGWDVQQHVVLVQEQG